MDELERLKSAVLGALLAMGFDAGTAEALIKANIHYIEALSELIEKKRISFKDALESIINIIKEERGVEEQSESSLQSFFDKLIPVITSVIRSSVEEAVEKSLEKSFKQETRYEVVDELVEYFLRHPVSLEEALAAEPGSPTHEAAMIALREIVDWFRKKELVLRMGRSDGKCPRCGHVLVVYEKFYYCPRCDAMFVRVKNKLVLKFLFKGFEQIYQKYGRFVAPGEK